MFDTIKNLFSNTHAGPQHPLRMRMLALSKLNDELEARAAQLSAANLLLTHQQELLVHSAKMLALGAMASGMAHEINSPLTIITVRANKLERLCQTEELSPQALIVETRAIATTAKRIGNIIKGMRAFAREGEDDPFDSIPVSTLVQDAFQLCQSRFKNHNVDLTVTSQPSDLALECRSAQIGQVLLSLLGNAFDAVAESPRKWVRVHVSEVHYDLIIAITDSGPGIPSEIQSRLMEPFFTTKEIGLGMGLGLSIAQGIVESHHGSLVLDPNAAHTRFVLTLPKLRPYEKLA